jgi:hypothetical protein
VHRQEFTDSTQTGVYRQYRQEYRDSTQIGI